MLYLKNFTQDQAFKVASIGAELLDFFSYSW